MNKMKQVALLFGKKLNERFIIDNHMKQIDAMFITDGLIEFCEKGSRLNNDLLTALLTDEVEIIDND